LNFFAALLDGKDVRTVGLLYPTERASDYLFFVDDQELAVGRLAVLELAVDYLAVLELDVNGLAVLKLVVNYLTVFGFQHNFVISVRVTVMLHLDWEHHDGRHDFGCLRVMLLLPSSSVCHALLFLAS